MDDNRSIWAYVRELEARVNRQSEQLATQSAELAVLKAWYAASQARSNQIPGWVIGAAALALSVLSALGNMWASGRLP